MGMALMGVGGLILAIGALLFWGNVSGNFVTFPYAGYVTLGIGGAVFGLGRKMQAQAALGKESA